MKKISGPKYVLKVIFTARSNNKQRGHGIIY